LRSDCPLGQIFGDMLLSYFHVEGFRSLASVTLEGLVPERPSGPEPEDRLLVFRGENGAGKSNILRAIELWTRLLCDGPHPGGESQPDFVSINDLNWNRPGVIRLHGKLVELGSHLERTQVANPFGLQTIEAVFDVEFGGARFSAKCAKYEVNSADLTSMIRDNVPQGFLANWSLVVQSLKTAYHRVDAFRGRVGALGPEPKGSLPARLWNLLFDAPHSSRAAVRKAYSQFQEFIQGPPLNRGVLSVVKDGEQLEVLESRKTPSMTRDVPVTSLGSGEEEVLVLLAWACLSGAAIVALEEPESHLHWTKQQLVREALEKLVSSKEMYPRQLFIESHSHEFQFGNSYWDVSLGDKDESHVERKPNSDAYKHFHEPGPIRDALRGLLKGSMRPEDLLYRTVDGRAMSAGEMLELLDRNDPAALSFLDDAARAVLRLMANEARRPR
jgi:hypothetical protein